MKLYTSGAPPLGDSLCTVEKETALPLRLRLFTELSKQWAGPGYGIRSDLVTSRQPAPLRRVRSTLVGPLAHPPTHPPSKKKPHTSVEHGVGQERCHRSSQANSSCRRGRRVYLRASDDGASTEQTVQRLPACLPALRYGGSSTFRVRSANSGISPTKRRRIKLTGEEKNPPGRVEVTANVHRRGL